MLQKNKKAQRIRPDYESLNGLSSRIRFKQYSRSNSVADGAFPSVYRGQSMEFEDLRPYDGKTTGHLYVVPEAHAQEVFDALKSKVEKYYVREHPNQEFYLNIYNVDEVIVGKLEDINWRAPQPYCPKELRGKLSVDGHFYILVLDQTIGAYAIPNDWHHTIRVKDHKATLVPNAHKPNKDGTISID